MSILVRLAIVWLLMGFALGLVARGLCKDRLKLIPFAFSFLPWLIHLLYLIKIFAVVLNQTQLIIFVGSSVAIALFVFWVGLRSIGRAGRSLSLLPILLFFFYGFGPVSWLPQFVGQDLALSYVPTLLLAAGTLSAFSMLFSYHLPTFKFARKKKSTKEKAKSVKLDRQKKRRQS